MDTEKVELLRRWTQFCLEAYKSRGDHGSDAETAALGIARWHADGTPDWDEDFFTLFKTFEAREQK